MLVKQSKLRRSLETVTQTGNKGLLSNLQNLSDFRMHVADILCTDFATIDHTHETLELMRNACAGDEQKIANIDSLESKIAYTLKHRPRLHSEILASAIAVMRLVGAKSVIDIGCGEGLLLRALLKEDYIKRIVGIDCDEQHLDLARTILTTARMTKPGTPEPQLANDLKGELDLEGFDVATVIEVIEHIEDKRWIDKVFALRPKHIVVTTPNKELNVLYNTKYLTPDGLRHSDHKFEFTREEFLVWAKDCASRHGYFVDLLPIGQATIELGGTVMMAVFTRIGS